MEHVQFVSGSEAGGGSMEIEQHGPPLTRSNLLYKRVDRFYDSRQSIYQEFPTSIDVVRERDEREAQDLAFHVRRNLSGDKKYQDTVLVIKSQELGVVIDFVLRSLEGFDNNIGVSSLISPYILYHFLDDFRAFDSTTMIFMGDERKAQTHLAALISFLETEYKFDIDFLDELLSHKQPQITFDLLWLILRPKTLILRDSTYGGVSHQCLSTLMHIVPSPQNIALKCQSVNFDGTTFGFEEETFWLHSFPGLKEITSLNSFPLHFHPDPVTVERRLAKRGRRFFELCGHGLGKTYVHCKGIVEVYIGDITDEAGEFICKKSKKLDLNSRIMLDPTTFWRIEYPDNKPEVEKIEEFLEDRHFRLCKYLLPGFVMEHKKWGMILLSQVTDIQWANDMLSNVVLDKTTKDLVRRFVSAHRSSPAHRLSVDVVPGKGAGLIMLFTGPPGVGKTVTAEAVAEISHRPLYSISASELGCEPPELDKNLERILQQGSLWDAVLLLDEADVFLEQRTSFDVQRNALVSIFLRQLEYYTGIIILTSNRVETFDKALESRVHFNLRFKELDRDSRIQLWGYFLQDQHQAISSIDLSRLADLKFNGRMIQHAVSLGRSLAAEREESLSYGHIQKVLDFVDPTRNFQKVPGQPRAREELPCASPLDPGTHSTTATPAMDIYGTPAHDPNVASKRPRYAEH